jgi:hypothetical protein
MSGSLFPVHSTLRHQPCTLAFCHFGAAGRKSSPFAPLPQQQHDIRRRRHTNRASPTPPPPPERPPLGCPTLPVSTSRRARRTGNLRPQDQELAGRPQPLRGLVYCLPPGTTAQTQVAAAANHPPVGGWRRRNTGKEVKTNPRHTAQLHSGTPRTLRPAPGPDGARRKRRWQIQPRLVQY